VNKRFWNWRLWVGFILSILALITYARWVLDIRDVFWLSVAIFVVAGAFLVVGLRRAFSQPDAYRGRLAGPILTGFSVLILALLVSANYLVGKHFPAARNAPKVGQPAPAFSLVNTAGKTVLLADVLSTPIADPSGSARPPKAVLLVFYRGYW
jgi:hypothetical protein